MDLKQEARQICGTLDASLPRPKTKDDILQIINFAMQILPNIFDRPEFSAGDTVAYLNRRTMTDYSFVTANNIGKLADSDGNILDNFSFISRNTLGELDPEYSYLTVDVRDSHGNCDPYCVKMEPRSLFKWSIQSVDPERGLYATLVCFYENGFDWTISHHDKNIRDDFTWYEPNMFNNFSILQAWDRKGNAWEELGQNAAFSTLTVFQGVNNPFYGIAIRDSEEACQLLGGKLIESDKELHFFIKAFQRAFEDEQETLTYNQLANLRIPLKIGIPTFLDMQQNCSESGTKEHKETRCGSRVFDPSEYIDIDIVPVYNHDESGGTVVSTLDLNWFNYLQGRNLLRLFRPKSAAVDQICIQK
ncbi:Oidioi.mRNA.OKI2018_I69.chr1.g634.t1.cds [Oikopleura dioica]|uniref:Oidioi.mRNA.OKI2018_I69.chr1.g634.t1.cds n=1 Tax=Oikopleura dioica TaxID=34765 RepID=A0ABN7SP40_OIKDI|nr:Oidioi.mRNA.OKI2018_I69.chr1.g634.t1.cds [Oikopleura dioica]